MFWLEGGLFANTPALPCRPQDAATVNKYEKRVSEVSGPLEKKTDSAGFKSYFLLEAVPGAAAAFRAVRYCT